MNTKNKKLILYSEETKNYFKSIKDDIDFYLNDADAYIRKGISLYNMNDFKLASKHFDKAIQLDSNYANKSIRSISLNELDSINLKENLLLNRIYSKSDGYLNENKKCALSELEEIKYLKSLVRVQGCKNAFRSLHSMCKTKIERNRNNFRKFLSKSYTNLSNGKRKVKRNIKEFIEANIIYYEDSV